MKVGGNKKKNIIKGISIIAVVVVFLCLFINSKLLDEEEMRLIIINDWKTLTESEKTPEYIKKIAEMSEFEITGIKYKEKSYEVTVNVKSIDLGGTLSKTDVDKYPTTRDEDELNAFLINVINESPKIETQAIVRVELINSKEYQVSYSEEFVDSMSGMVYTYSKNMIGQAMSEYTY